MAGEHSGTRWYKTDFQCHTPRDRHWQGSPNLPGGRPEHEAKRREWAREFIDACRARGIGAVAITDHHDVCLFSYVRDALNEHDDLIVFPGVEVTCKDVAQVLAIFDPRCEESLLQNFLGSLRNVNTADRHSECTAEIEPADLTVDELFQQVHGDERFRDSCVLLPHFSNQQAHKSLNTPGHHKRFAGISCDGIYIEIPYSELEGAALDKVRGNIPEWGERRRAVIATGDNRRATWDRLGAHECWVKFGESTIESFRQALLADEARITYSRPEEPAEVIEKLTVLSSLTGDEPVSVTFNSGFNALIGGRGSGKSSLLQYLRFALGRSPSDAGKELSDVDERDRKLLKETLADGYVEIVLRREGVREMWRRTANQNTIEITAPDADAVSITVEQAQQRFKARGYSQKELSSTMSVHSRAADQITGIVAAEEVEQRRQIEKSIEAVKREISGAFRKEVARWQAVLEDRQAQEKVRDLSRRVETSSASLEKAGVPRESLDIIEAKPAYTKAASYFEGEAAALVEDARRVSALAASLLKDGDVKAIPASIEKVHDYEVKKEKARDEVARHLSEVLSLIDSLGRERQALEEVFSVEKKKFEESYNSAVALQQAHKAVLDENARLTKELEAAEAVAASASGRVKVLREAFDGLQSARNALLTLIEQREAVLSEAANKVADHSGRVLMAKASTKPISKERVESIADGGLFAGSRVQDVPEKVEGWLVDLRASTGDVWAAVCAGFSEIYEKKILEGSPPEPSDELSEAIQNFLFGPAVSLTTKQISKIYTNLSDEVISKILVAQPRNEIVLTYVDEGRRLPFEKASPGQQAAALLELLLQQSAGTLLIDQPEDDLDNRVIMKIVELLRTSKSRRQLIFATHNANFVVNGDADKVISLKAGEVDPRPDRQPPRVVVHEDGAIETPAIRTSITEVMEGGSKAFGLRSRKYRFGV